MSINYTGSSNAMEVEAACRLRQRSEDHHDLRYTGFLSDCDSKAHKAVCDLDIYPEFILKEECINHVHKRMVRKERADRWVKQRQQLATQEVSEGTTYAAGEF